MKKITLLLFSFVCLTAHAQQWDWARKATSTTGTQSVKKICTDNLGNIYALGINYNQAIYGVNILDSGSFVVKYDSTGNLKWAKKIEGNPNDISCDAAGNILVLGNFYGNITIGAFNLISSGSSDIFFAKLSGTGLISWVKTFGGLKYDHASSFTIDNNADFYITGLYTDSILLENILLKDSTGAGSSSFFLEKLNSTGNVQWANSGPRNFLSSNVKYASGTCVKLTKAQDVFVLGECFFSPGGYGMDFIMKYNSSGYLLLNATLGGWSQYAKNTFVVDNSSNIFFVWNSGTHYYYDPELVKYDSLINYKWSVKLSDCCSSNYFLSDGLSVDDSGYIYLAGELGGFHMQSDSLQVCNQWLVRKGGFDILIGKFHNSGNCAWFKSAGGKNDEVIGENGNAYALQITMHVDKKGSCYVMGVYNVSGYSHIYNDTVSFGNSVLVNDGSWEQLFVAKLNSINMTTGIEAFFKPNSSFILFPNPTSGVFTLQIHNCQVGAKVIVRDVLGNCLFEKNCQGETSEEINLSYQPRGIYFIELLAGEAKVVKKVAVQ